MALPKTTATVGMPAAESRVRSRKTRPPGMKISAWVGRSAPPDSTRLTIGSRLASAISPARWVFFSVYGLTAPPRTVGSFATIMHATPSTTPMPVTTLAPTGKSVPHAATGDSSRNGASAVDQQLDALAGQQLAPGVVAGHVLLAAAGRAPASSAASSSASRSSMAARFSG